MFKCKKSIASKDNDVQVKKQQSLGSSPPPLNPAALGGVAPPEKKQAKKYVLTVLKNGEWE